MFAKTALYLANDDSPHTTCAELAVVGALAQFR